MGETDVETQNAVTAKVLHGQTGMEAQVPDGLWGPCVSSATFLPLQALSSSCIM